MRTLARAVIIVGLLAGGASALRRPSPESNSVDKAMLRRAQEFIDAAQGVDQVNVNKAVEKLKRLQKKYGESRYEFERKEIVNEIGVAEAGLSLARYFQNESYAKAALIVAKVYGIVPSERVRPSVMGGVYKNVVATWMIRVGDPEEVKIIDKEGNVLKVAPERASDEAAAFVDGTVRLHHSAFGRGIGFLASTLYHESIHFEQTTTKGLGDRMNAHQREVRVYEAEINAADIFGLTDDEVKEFRRRKEDNAMSLEPIPWQPGKYYSKDGSAHQGGEDGRSGFPDIESELELARRRGQQLEESVDEEFRQRREAVADRQRQEEADRVSEQAHRKLKEWAALACQSPDWPSKPGFGPAAVAEMFGRLRVPSRPIDLSGLPFGPMGCATFLENQILLRRFDAGGKLPAGWLEETVSKARQVGRSLANQEARTVLQSWLESECSGSGVSASATPERVRAAYEALLIQEAVLNMWEMSYYTGIPCPKLMMNLLLQERQAGRPFAGWDSWFDRVRLARERSRSGPPATAVPPAGGSAPPPSRSDDFSDGDRRPPPDVPHCRYHRWCRG